MYTLEEIRILLEDRNVQAIARKTGLSPRTIYYIRNGGKRATLETVQKLWAYLNG